MCFFLQVTSVLWLLRGRRSGCASFYPWALDLKVFFCRNRPDCELTSAGFNVSLNFAPNLLVRDQSCTVSWQDAVPTRLERGLQVQLS